MRKHFKYLRKEKGLTLVELLAVLVILGIVAAIAIPLIGNIIQDSRDKATVNEALNIIAAAKLAATNGETETEEGGYTVQDLITNGYLDNELSGYNSVKASYDTNGWKLTSLDTKIATAINNLGAEGSVVISDTATEKQLLQAVEKQAITANQTQTEPE